MQPMNSPDLAKQQPYVSVRALARGINILRALNKLGRASPPDLARETGLDRTTAYRLLATLESLGLVQRSTSNDEYILLAAVRELSDGFSDRDRTIGVVGTQLGTLFQKVLWPTDFATFERGSMVIRETTHRFSPYSVHRAMVGQPRGLFTSALGRAALVGASAEERATMIEIAEGTGAKPPSPWKTHADALEWILNDYEQRRYAWSVGGSEGRISAIGVPLKVAGGPAGAINLVFFRSAMTVETAAERYLEAMQQCVGDILHALADPSGD